MLTIFDTGMKKLLITDGGNMKKYAVINKNDNGIEANKHYELCEKNKRPYITIVKGRTYSRVDVDCISLPSAWDEYIKKNDVKCTFNLALERMGITKNGLEVSGLGYTSHFDVKNEFAEMFAEFLYNYYDILIIGIIHDTEVELKRLKKESKIFEKYDTQKNEEKLELENKIKELEEILKK